MQRLAICYALVLPCAAALAQGNPDLMKTPECLVARKQLDEAFAAGGPRERLNAAREQGALKCFGVKPAPAPEGRFVPPPVALEPIRLRPERALPRPPSAVTQPAAPVAAPPVVTTCDAADCWDSKGARYNQQGPMPMVPQGACPLQGGLRNCP